MDIKNSKSSLLKMLSAVLFFATAAVQLVSLISDLSKSYRDTQRWGGVSGFMLFNKFALLLVICLGIAALLVWAKSNKALANTLKAFAGIELMLCFYSVMKDLQIMAGNIVWLYLLETLLAVLAIIALCAVVSMKSFNTSPYKYAFAVTPAVLMVLSVVLSAVRVSANKLTYIDSQFAMNLDLYVTPILLAVAFVTLAFSLALAPESEK